MREECERLAETRHQPVDTEWAFLSTKGSHILDGRGLALLRSLHRFREREAVRRDRPPFKVMSDAVLVGLAASPESDLETVKGLGRYGRPPASKSLRAAITRRGPRRRRETPAPEFAKRPAARPIRAVEDRRASAQRPRAGVRGRVSSSGWTRPCSGRPRASSAWRSGGPASTMSSRAPTSGPGSAANSGTQLENSWPTSTDIGRAQRHT